MPRQLLIAASFPPSANAEAVVTANMVWECARQGWQSVVCTPDPHVGGGTLDNDLCTLLPATYERRVSGVRRDDLFCLLLRRVGLRGLSRVCEAVPDSMAGWIGPAIRSARKALADIPCDCIHSRALPFSDHLIALALKRATGLPWVAHFSDPFAAGPFYHPPLSLVKTKHVKWRTQVLHSADRLTFTTAAARDLLVGTQDNALRAKSRVIPHGFRPDQRLPALHKTVKDDFLRIASIGSFYGNRSAIPLLDALAALVGREGTNAVPLRLELVGRMPHQEYARICSRGRINSLVTLRPPVGYEEARTVAARADALLVVDTVCTPPDLFLQSKLIEYLGLGRPLWGLVIPGSHTHRVMREINGEWADYRSSEEIIASLRRLLYNWRKKRLHAPDPGHPVVREYRLSHSVALLREVLDELTAGGNGPRQGAARS